MLAGIIAKENKMFLSSLYELMFKEHGTFYNLRVSFWSPNRFVFVVILSGTEMKRFRPNLQKVKERHQL